MAGTGKRKKKAHTTEDGYCYVDTQFGEATGSFGSLLLTYLTADKVCTGSELKGRTLDNRRLRPVETGRPQIGEGSIEKTETQKTLVIA